MIARLHACCSMSNMKYTKLSCIKKRQSSTHHCCHVIIIIVVPVGRGLSHSVESNDINPGFRRTRVMPHKGVSVSFQRKRRRRMNVCDEWVLVCAYACRGHLQMISNTIIVDIITTTSTITMLSRDTNNIGTVNMILCAHLRPFAQQQAPEQVGESDVQERKGRFLDGRGRIIVSTKTAVRK